MNSTQTHGRKFEDDTTHRFQTKPQTQAQPQTKKILVVEDDMELSTILEKILKVIDPQLKVEWVTSAEQALVLLKDHARVSQKPPYDMLIVDIFLDGESTGIELWEICQESFPYMQVVIMSALPIDRFFSSIGRDTIAPPYISKPFSVGECKQILEGVLQYKQD